MSASTDKSDCRGCPHDRPLRPTSGPTGKQSQWQVQDQLAVVLLTRLFEDAMPAPGREHLLDNVATFQSLDGKHHCHRLLLGALAQPSLPARSGRLRISPTADIRSGLSLHIRTDSLNEPAMNQAVTTHQHVLRISIIRTGGSGE